MKLACVIHRFGPAIAGGSEAHCRGIAERLARTHDVTVLTTCAKDHITWRNEYPAGASTAGGVKILRFPVARTRALHRFRDISDRIAASDVSPEEQDQWFLENGPDAPELLAYLGEHGAEYDRVLFWAFRYAPTYFGLPLVARRAVLVPTAEDDPVIRLEVLRRFFALPSGLVFLTPEEERLVARRAGERLPPSVVIGSGLEPCPPDGAMRSGPELAAAGLARPFVLYLGRVDPNKGCGTLVRYFLDADQRQALGAKLVMAGPANMPIPHDPALVPLGFVSDPLREALLTETSALVMPSPYESLSMVLLEAWNHGRPALVNGRCGVLKGQAVRSNGALWYRSFDEFDAGLRRLLADARLAREMGENGRAYVDREYRWPRVMEKLETFLAGLS